MEHSRDYIQESVNQEIYRIVRGIHDYVDNTIFTEAGAKMIDGLLSSEEVIAKLLLAVILEQLYISYLPDSRLKGQVETYNKLKLTTDLWVHPSYTYHPKHGV